MTCSEIESRLPAYLDGLLPQEEKDRIAGHVSACLRCGRALADLKKTAEILRNLEAVEPPPFFEEKIMARVREEAGRKRGLLRRLFYPLHIRIPIQAMAMVLIAVAAVYVFQTGGPEMQRTVPLPAPADISGKGAVTAEPAKAPAHAPAAAPAGQASAPRPLEQIQERFPAPPVTKGGKEEGPSEFSAPLRKDRAPAPPPAQRGGEAIPAVVQQEAPDRARDKADRLGPGREAAEVALEQKMTRKTVGSATAEGAKGASPAAPLQSAVETRLDLKVYVGDASAATRAIVAALGRFGARIVESRHGVESGFLKAEIAARHVPAFLERLEGIGRVDREDSRPIGPDGTVAVRINIVGNP